MIKQVFVYKQTPRKDFDSFSGRANFIGDFNIRSGSRKRVLGKTAKAMASTLALNLDPCEFDGLCLRINAGEFEGLVRNGAAIPSTDGISSLEPCEIRAVLLELGRDGVFSIQVDNK